MFLDFQKLSTTPSRVLIKSDSIMLLESDSFTINGITYPNATRVEIAGLARTGFWTSSTFDQVSSVFHMLDVRTGYDPTVCGATLAYPIIYYPMIITNKISNSTLSEIESYAFNPSYLIGAETVTFTDVVSHTQETGLMISLQDSNPKRILTSMTYDQLKTILAAVSVPSS